MLPSVLAGQLQQGLTDYINTTFPMTNPVFQGSLEKMIATKDSVFHEPYISVRLPFRIADEMPDMFQAIHPQYKPYVHQQKAFDRLTGDDGRSSLIATGTGSGKTECFLYPILEYCYRHRGESGIKALIIYPMNALATDQAKRIAELIYNSPELRGNVTAGMYVGGHEKQPSRTMSEEQIITDHETMLSSPPDILLTNYKMLDYLLVRPKDAALWQENSPETLKFIAVDELHTFDGAQGTDLACLLRRLKARLFTPSGYLCCIGTSATMGTEDSAENIRAYADTVFGEPFETDAVIMEDRLSPSEFFDGLDTLDFTIPTEDMMSQLTSCIDSDDQTAYLTMAACSWFDHTYSAEDIMSDATRLVIGKRLMAHSFTRNLITYMGGNYMQPSHICEALIASTPQFVELKSRLMALDALVALISHARIGSAGKLRPFLTVQTQIWMRELRRLLAKVSGSNVTYALATDLNDQQAKHYLPIVNCRDCGETGWTSLINERGNLTITDLNTFYNLYFKQDSKVTMLFPHSHDNIPLQMDVARICPGCMQLHIGPNASKNCASCGTNTIPVVIPKDMRTSGSKDNQQYVCPYCGSRRGLAIIGLRSATAISASISQMFASKFNDDKKALAFSDNVQDAAHRAGFFNSRTWKFGLRSAIQRYALAEGNGLSLEEFSSGFIDYWHRQMSNEEFVSVFIAPNMTWMRAYEKMKTENKLASDKDATRLKSAIERRLSYEIMLEYGLTSRIGRTLEKSGCSTIEFDPKMVAEVASIVKERTRNELGTLYQSDVNVFERMVIGFLYIMRVNGAFNDSIFSAYAIENGKGWHLSNDKEKWLPGLQSGRNTPRFIYETLSNEKRLNSFDLVSNSKYADWIHFCIDEFFINEEVSDEIGKLILSELIKSGIVVPMPSSAGYKVWGLDKRKVTISTNVTQFACELCGSLVSIAKGNSHYWVNAPCLRNKCGGHLQLNGDESLGYYGKLYSNGDMVRVVAKEHTGLLERDDREELERVFKRGSDDRKPWDANLLSCTPTLEMGIDIGDLSTVVLCNIPPAQAQFLQRAGRAGRKDGNALTLAVANARPHDLYFYAEPMEMLSGMVEPPKIFLQASAVLERQFVAYCMDCWIKRGVPEQAIPRHVGTCLSKLISRPSDLFPFNFLTFVQNNLSNLLRTFIQMFSRYLDEDSITDLQKFAQGNRLEESPMHMKIYEAFENLKKQRDTLNSSIQQLKSLIKELEDKPKDSSYDDEIKELKNERMAFLNVVRNLNRKDVFNFLSDEGLLPNYAFPEAGIVLKAILYRRDDSNTDELTEGKKRKYEKMVYEYSRSASSAMSEFAPSNNFYVDGRKLTINQVDLTTAQSTKWRLCPNCSHAQIEETGRDVAACPQCGSPAWADSGQVRTLLKVQMVYSNMDYTKSLIGDESDDRNSTFYCKQMLVDVNEDHDIVKAYSMDNSEFTFGYEFVKKATMREINFGEKDLVGEKLTVAGTEEVRKGFKICKYCGKLQNEKGEPKHTHTCKAKKPQLGNADPYEECLFLYREFETEALRILIPATTMDTTQVRQESFTAAFMLGMKKYFGNVDHLKACLSEVPVLNAEYRKQYLVIYDSVPGGTGYLKQLMQRDNALVEILEKALTVMENCTCKHDPQKDGCYHCLYAYRQSQNIGQISRKTATHLLKLILSGKSNIEEIARLGNVPVNSLFESELERMFIEALGHMKNDKRKLTIAKELVNNKEGYALKIGECLWNIEPQVLLDQEYGIPVPSRADFVLWPARTSHGQRPIAVFTDGFLYHKDKVDDDTLKREAIRRSNRFRVWSLSWKDVQSAFRAQGDYATATLIPDNMPSGARVYRPTVEHGNAQILHPDRVSTFELLIQYLENLDAERLFDVHAQAYAMSLLDTRNINNSVAFTDWKYLVDPIIEFLDVHTNFELSNTIFGKWIPRSCTHLTILAGVASSDMQTNKSKAIISVCSLLNDDVGTRSEKYEAEWNGFWHFFNVMQFLQSFYAVSTKGLNLLVYNAIPMAMMRETAASIDQEQLYDVSWIEVKEQIFDDITKACVTKLMRLGISAPSIVGYELQDSSAAIIAECELAWEEEKIALLLPTQLNHKHIFEANGWRTFLLEEEFTAYMFQGGHEE
ncbi:DEAD/DEAH box helicase [Paenibacillus sp. B-A-8]|uniref:DEAD/DEAH box helicase n=1 Tax=Paenibacillus sp. B-A-8 TaxID=3400419 RepID=UPI003B015EDA